MIKIFLSLILIISLSYAGWIGSLKPDKEVGNISLFIGQASLEEKKDTLYGFDFGGNYYYNNGVLLGATFGLGYADESFELNGKFKLGYSFGEIAKGLALYGIGDFSYLMYNRLNSQLKEKTTFAQGIGFGGGIEYRFNNDWLFTASYTTTNMIPDIGINFDYNKALIGVGYTF